MANIRFVEESFKLHNYSRNILQPEEKNIQDRQFSTKQKLVHDTIILKSSYSTGNIYQGIINMIQNKLGTLIGNDGILVDFIPPKEEDIPSGYILYNGDIKFNITYSAELLFPKKGDVVEERVTRVMESGIIIELSLSVNNNYSSTSQDIYSFSKNAPFPLILYIPKENLKDMKFEEGSFVATGTSEVDGVSSGSIILCEIVNTNINDKIIYCVCKPRRRDY